jgi:hypothetical protein
MEDRQPQASYYQTTSSKTDYWQSLADIADRRRSHAWERTSCGSSGDERASIAMDGVAPDVAVAFVTATAMLTSVFGNAVSTTLTRTVDYGRI